ncbi:MAG: sulfotransferase family protein [Phycisphaerales bacterium JB047]
MSEPISKHPEHPGPDFVIVGPLRAGTTMFRLMLGSHPQIADVGEFEESVAMLGDTGFPSPKHYREWLATHRVAQSRKYNLPDNLNDYQSIAYSMWSQLAQRHTGAKVIGCTIHSRIDRILDLWPNTKLICLVRDPRDVCRSCVGMGWYGHPALAYPEWLDPIHRWESAKERIPDDCRTIVRYEDLLRNPQLELSKCAELLGLDYSPAMLSFHESSSYDMVNPKLAEQWKRKMPPRCAELIDWRCAQAMANYGYQRSSMSPRPPTTFERFSLRLRNKTKRIKWRMNQYGPYLVAAWSIAKHLPPSNRIHLQIKSKLNQIDNSRLK